MLAIILNILPSCRGLLGFLTVLNILNFAIISGKLPTSVCLNVIDKFKYSIRRHKDICDVRT